MATSGYRAYRRKLVRRILTATGLGVSVSGVAALSLAQGCSGKSVVDGTAGSGGSTATTSSNVAASSSSGCTENGSSASGGAVYHYSLCLDDAGGDCPSGNEANQAVQAQLDAACCSVGDTCEELSGIDCGPFSGSGGPCCYEVTTEETFCAVPGRPFVVDGAATVAELRATRWHQEACAPQLDGLTDRERQLLGEQWAESGLYEHASIASFARFTLELLRFGAPPELVRDAQRAQSDELRHAEVCFAFACAYGHEVGPGPLAMDGELHNELARFAAATAAEGCVGETLSALVIAEQLARATDPAVCAALTAIADDEARHAELAWRTVKWALAIGDDTVRQAVVQVFADAARYAPPSSNQLSSSGALEEHGWIDQLRSKAVIEDGLRDAVLPCARAMLAS